MLWLAIVADQSINTRVGASYWQTLVAVSVQQLGLHCDLFFQDQPLKNLSAYCWQTLPVEKNHRELIFLILKTVKYSKLNFRADQDSKKNKTDHKNFKSPLEIFIFINQSNDSNLTVLRIIKIWNTLVSKSCSMLKTFMKALAPPIPVDKVNVVLSDPETPVTPYEFWLEHKPDLLFGEPIISLIFVVYQPHSSFQGKLEIYVTSCVLEPFNSCGDSRFEKLEDFGLLRHTKKKYWSSLNHLQYFLRAHNIF